MGRDFYLQDDTFLAPQQGFRNSDGKSFTDLFLDEPFLNVFAEELAVDVAPFRRIADDQEWWHFDETTPEDVVRAELQKLQQAMDAAWQPPATLAKGIEEMLAAIDGPDGFPLQLLEAIKAVQLPFPRNIDKEYYQAGELAGELRELQVKLRHSMLRGATRVRLLYR